MSSKVQRSTSTGFFAACKHLVQGSSTPAASPRSSKSSLLMTAAAVALGVLSADKLLLAWLPDTLGAGEKWDRLQQEDSAFVFFVCLGLGYLSFTALSGAPRKTKRPPAKADCSAGAPVKKVASAPRQPPCAELSALQKVCTEGPAAPEAAPRPRPLTLARLNVCVSQVAQDDPEKAGRVLEELRASGCECTTTSYNIVIRACLKKGDIEGTHRWMRKMVKAGFAPDSQSYMLVIHACIKAEDIDAAEAWMQRMNDAQQEPNPTMHMMLVNACARQSSIPRAEQWLRKMIDAGLQPDVTCYNCLIHACGLRCDVARAERLFQELTDRQLEPTVMTFTSLIDGCAKSLDVKRAEKWMEAMIARGIEPNVVSFSTMINACAKVGDLRQAEHWLHHMQEQGVLPNAYCYSALINACARVGDVGSACQWLQRAESAGTAMDAVVYGCVINACGKVGDAERAMAVFRQMQAQGIRSHIVVYAALARPFAYRGEWQEVERIREEMEGEGIATNEYFLYTQILAYARAKPRQSERAEAVFCAAVTSGLTVNERVFKALTCAVGRIRCSQLSQLPHNEALRVAEAYGPVVAPARTSAEAPLPASTTLPGAPPGLSLA